MPIPVIIKLKANKPCHILRKNLEKEITYIIISIGITKKKRIFKKLSTNSLFILKSRYPNVEYNIIIVIKETRKGYKDLLKYCSLKERSNFLSLKLREILLIEDNKGLSLLK